MLDILESQITYFVAVFFVSKLAWSKDILSNGKEESLGGTELAWSETDDWNL